jgi:2-dehydropantoate 2-reductase
MEALKFSNIGIGATGAVIAAALLSRDHEVALVDLKPNLEQELKEKGLVISGELSYRVPVKHFFSDIEDLKSFKPNVVFISSKTFHLNPILDKLETIFTPGMKIISTHNGLGTEEVIAQRFGDDSVYRMSLNFGVSLHGLTHAEVAFFNRPNHLGGVKPGMDQMGSRIAEVLTACGMDTEYVEDIKLYVWKKMIMKCTMASICAVTDKTIKQALEFPPTREIAMGCFEEILAVAKAKGYDLGEDYLDQALAYLEKVGIHKDSMCTDIENRTQTEIDFLGGKVVEYAREMGIDTPYYITMTNLVKSLEDQYR